MIIEDLKQQLTDFFPPPEEELQREPDEITEDTEKTTKKVDSVRQNGFIQCDYATKGYHLDIQIDPSQVYDITALIDNNDFFLETITGVDWIKENQMEVVYDFSRFDRDLCRVVVRTRIDRSDPSIDTISDIYPGANWHERETHDFFGIKFNNHPCLEPLLLPEDADFHPLLKDYKP